MNVELGIIEGFYGKPWTWQERLATVAFLAPHGYRFYHYAPKADVYLRKQWQEMHDPAAVAELTRFAEGCRAHGVRFGVGLSPSRLHHVFDDAAARAALQHKLEFFDALGIDDLAVLFDDMRGDVPDLADRQAEIVEWAAQRTRATRVFVCPSYYTDDPVLDRVFGARPAGYLQRLGAALDPALEVFWTGEEVCSREISIGHVERVAGALRRKPFLWDNYPVNDGERMSQYLHLRGFTGRPAALADVIAGHGVNPALQPTLTHIPALTLSESYRTGLAYCYGEAFRRAAVQVLGESLGGLVWEDLLTLQDVGLDRLGDRAGALRARYEGVDHAGAREIIAWLDGAYRITDSMLAEQAGES